MMMAIPNHIQRCSKATRNVLLLPAQYVIYWILILTIITQYRRMVVQSYPVLLQVDEATERCIRFNIPDGDDAHIAALVLPNEDELNDPNVEDWYVTELYELCKQKGKHQALKKVLPHDIPTNIVMSKSNYMREHHSDDDTSKCKIKITGTPNSDPKTFQHNYNTKYFDLVTINNVGRTTDARAKKPKPGQNHNAYRTVGDHLEGYGICFHNQDQYRAVQVIFDILLSSEVVAEGDTQKAALDFEKGRHLTPLEESLEESIASARTILREMTFMEKRELRMRRTAESINLRVRYFSYLSVSVLLAVTYIQVSYLKRYFHKKKLM